MTFDNWLEQEGIGSDAIELKLRRAWDAAKKDCQGLTKAAYEDGGLDMEAKAERNFNAWLDEKEKNDNLRKALESILYSENRGRGAQGGKVMNPTVEVSWSPNEIEWLQKWLKWLKDAPLMVTEQDRCLARVWIKKLEIHNATVNGCYGIGLGK